MSFIGWFDHDPGQERSVLSALSAAKGHDARDELGLGTIRDSFADSFFPGLSSVQTRLRYFLFVQWGCEQAAKGSDESDIVGRLGDGEVELIKKLTPLGPGQGVIGIESQEALERKPSDVYWTGLRTFGMLRFGGGRRHWARLAARNRHQHHRAAPGESGDRPPVDIGFDMSRPPPPEGFPSITGINFRLEPDERPFLRERLSDACVNPGRLGQKHNLFRALAGHRRLLGPEIAKPWDHPSADRLNGEAQAYLMLAGAFSRVLYGATILYNLLVAEQLARGEGEDYRERYSLALRDWQGGLDPRDVVRVRTHLREVQRLADYTRHRIPHDALLFAATWAEHCEAPERLHKNRLAGDLVINREIFLKGGRGTSRFQNLEARRRWGGQSGGELDYRWPVARQYLNDLVL